MEGVSMTLSLANKVAQDKFFQPPSKFYNHKVVEILSINEDSGIATVILEKYTISGNANVYKNNNVFTIELPYSEFQYLRGWENN
jgi:formamidopyrimidine-DNA glycosylase